MHFLNFASVVLFVFFVTVIHGKGTIFLEFLFQGSSPKYTIIKSPLPLDLSVKAMRLNSCFNRIKLHAEFGSILISSGTEAIHVIPSKVPENSLKLTILFIENNKLSQIVTFQNLPLNGPNLYDFKMNTSHVSSGGQSKEFNKTPEPYRGDHRFGIAFFQYELDECGLMLNFNGFLDDTEAPTASTNQTQVPGNWQQPATNQ